MLAPYDVERNVQACAVLLKAEPSRRVSRLRLMKLLYIADREMVQKRGRSITGDRFCAMEHGPVLSNTYDLIKGESQNSAWVACLSNAGRDIILKNDPGVGKLTRLEVQKLHEVSERYFHLDDYGIALITHDFTEWRKNNPGPGRSKPIPVDDLLEAVGMLEHKDSILEAARCESKMNQLSQMVE